MEAVVSKLKQSLPGKVFQYQDEGYTESLQSYFSQQENSLQPACVVRPNSAQDVSTVVSTIYNANRWQPQSQPVVKFAIRSGGHAAFARSANEPDGVTIDLRSLDAIAIAADRKTVDIGAGASWGSVFRALEPLGLAVPGGRHSQVGVGGLTLGGGLSHFSPLVGLVCDNVLAYELVLGSGKVVHVDSSSSSSTGTGTEAEENSKYSDLIRALRGGANNFGIVTRFTFRVLETHGRKLWGGMLIHSLESKAANLQAFHDFAAADDFDPNANVIQSYGFTAAQGSGVVNALVYTNADSSRPVVPAAAAVPAALAPFTKLEPIHMNTLRELTISELAKEQDAFNTNGLCQYVIATTFYLESKLLHNALALWEASCENIKSYEGAGWSLTFQAIVPRIMQNSPFLQSAVPPPPSTLPQEEQKKQPKKAIIIAQIVGMWKNPADTPAFEHAGAQLTADIDAATTEHGRTTGYLYLNYAHAGQRVFDGHPAHKNFLQLVSRKYDPDGVFQYAVPGGFKLF